MVFLSGGNLQALTKELETSNAQLCPFVLILHCRHTAMGDRKFSALFSSVAVSRPRKLTFNNLLSGELAVCHHLLLPEQENASVQRRVLYCSQEAGWKVHRRQEEASRETISKPLSANLSATKYRVSKVSFPCGRTKTRRCSYPSLCCVWEKGSSWLK